MRQYLFKKRCKDIVEKIVKEMCITFKSGLEESINELARLLGDGSMTDATILNAKELKNRSKNLILS